MRYVIPTRWMFAVFSYDFFRLLEGKFDAIHGYRRRWCRQHTHTHTMWAHEGYSIGEHTSFVLSHQHPMFTPLYTVSGVKWINTKSARASSHGEKDTRISDSIVEQTETTRAEELHFSVAINVKNKKMVFLFSRPKIDFLTNSNATSRSIRSFSIFMFVGHEKWFQTMSVLGEFLA